MSPSFQENLDKLLIFIVTEELIQMMKEKN